MNDLSFIDFLAQSYNSSPDWIKFAWVFGFSAALIALILSLAWLIVRWRGFSANKEVLLAKAALKEHEMHVQVITKQQEILAMLDVDPDAYNLPDCPIPVVKKLPPLSIPPREPDGNRKEGDYELDEDELQALLASSSKHHKPPKAN